MGLNFAIQFINLGYKLELESKQSNYFLIDSVKNSSDFGYFNVDISNRNSIESILFELSPDIVINCCASTDVDFIEKSPIVGISSNIIGVLNINEFCRKYGIKQIYFSTEAAFDGAKYLKYFETDAENPQSKYALTKVVADNIILNSDSQAWIFRTSWLYSLNSKSSFVTRILEKSKSSHTNIGVTDDLFGNPTPAWWLASTVINLLKDIENLPTGLYHLCSSRAVSKYDWAKRIIADLNPEKVSLIVPTKRNDFPNAHLRSPYVDLSTDKIQKFLGKSLIPTWEDLWKESIK